jgi:hypothetical protein
MVALCLFLLLGMVALASAMLPYVISGSIAVCGLCFVSSAILAMRRRP